MENKLLIDALIKEGLIDAESGRKTLQEAAMARRPVEEMVQERRLVDEDKLAALKSRLLGIPYKKIDPAGITDDLLKSFPEETVRNYKVIPISAQGDLLVAGMINPDDAMAQEALKFIAKQKRLNLGVYIITPSVWETILRRYSPYRSMVD